MTNNIKEVDVKKNATIFLVSGEFDKALAAFEVATGFAAMGVHVDMWFIFYGINSIKKPRSFVERCKQLFKVYREAPGRRHETDIMLQRVVPFLNSSSCRSVPLSHLHLFGLGTLLVNFLMRHKQSPSLQQLVLEAEKLGVSFKICQPCVDVMMINADEDLIVNATVSGVSSYAVDALNSHFNVTF